jgi:hypothetical protein
VRSQSSSDRFRRSLRQPWSGWHLP